MTDEQELSDLIVAEINKNEAGTITEVHRNLTEAGLYDKSYPTFYRDYLKLREELIRKGLIPEDFGKKSVKRDPVRDKYIAQGLTLEQIAEEEAKEKGLEKPVTHQAIRQYIKTTEQHKNWKEKRYEIKERERKRKKQFLSERQSLVNLLNEHLWKKAVDEGIAYEKAVLYHLTRKNRDPNIVPLDKLIPLFETYYQAKEQDKKLSLKELAKITNISFTTISVIFKAVDEEPMHGSLERITISSYKKQAIKRAHSQIQMNMTSIAYFLELPQYVVNQNMKRIGKRKRYPQCIIRFGSTKHLAGIVKEDILTYAKASQIYEALDAGFSKGEVCEYADVTKKIFDYAVRRRKSISKKIIKTLRILYPDKDYTTPYLVPEKRVA